ncbi:uncharacterized protein CDAR_35911 [Caerostris darwini]|uniref:Uncharacterized protein n=1 Tax=Caerostris darwini TaxID=1538125 RepID=A0AAV4R6K5_9ARAC|nr:uncharacterized protein CDAR_35911 [Caerostris darwini]
MADGSRDSGRFVPEFYCSWLRISFQKKRLEAELVTPEAMNFSYGLLQVNSTFGKIDFRAEGKPLETFKVEDYGKFISEPPIPEYDTDPLLPVDPEGCLRNREEAAARGRQCLRKCASDADCISTRKRCLCDGLCGWSCIRPAPSFLKTPRATEGNFTPDFREHFRIVRIA